MNSCQVETKSLLTGDTYFKRRKNPQVLLSHFLTFNSDVGEVGGGARQGIPVSRTHVCAELNTEFEVHCEPSEDGTKWPGVTCSGS